MANAMYTSFKNALGNRTIDLLDDSIRLAAVDTSEYTFSDSHSTYSDLSGVKFTGTLSGKTFVGKTFDSDDLVLSAASGDPFDALVMWDYDTGNLIAYFDEISATPNGTDITIAAPEGGWFDL